MVVPNLKAQESIALLAANRFEDDVIHMSSSLAEAACIPPKLARIVTPAEINEAEQEQESTGFLVDEEDDENDDRVEYNFDSIMYPRKRRRVQFCGEFRADCIIRSNYVIENERDIWYSRDELSELKREAKKACRAIQSDETALNHAYNNPESLQKLQGQRICKQSQGFQLQRGLERWCSMRHAVARELTLIQVRTEVLLEQSRQTLLREEDPDRLAEVYAAVSRPSANFAHVLGLADAIAAGSDGNHIC